MTNKLCKPLTCPDREKCIWRMDGIMETDKPCVPAMRRRVRELEAKVARLLRERVCGGCRRTIPGEEPCCDPATNPANKGDGRQRWSG